MSLNLVNKIEKQILDGNFTQAEKEFYQTRQKEATQEFQAILTGVTQTAGAHKIAGALRKQHSYRNMRKQEVTITTMTGDKIKIPTWYAVKKGKKKGKFKKGPNGRGVHLLLKYWGFIGKQSLNYTTNISRQGVSCQSYDLAEETLKEQGINISSNSIDKTTQKVGTIARRHRDRIALSPQESFKDKRIMISVDGGRIRMREKKSGRYSKKQKLAKFETNWREPKLLVIAELNDEGEFKKDTRSIYEATMENHDAIFDMLEKLSLNCQLDQAKEIILSGDGAKWIWDKFQEFAKKLGISHKVTQILDFYHATEHLTEISEADPSLDVKEQKQWFSELKELLRNGKFRQLKNNVTKVSKEKKIPCLMELWQYFEHNKDRMRYDVYEKNNQPIGSGIVESAVRRVINLKLKAPGIFWSKEKLENMLILRCILMAGRWNIFKNNLLQTTRLELV